MAQTPAKRITSRGDTVDYTPSSAVVAGDVVMIGSQAMVATQAIAANCLGSLSCDGVFDLPKTADVFAIGDAVYWNASGTDVGSNTGAADNTTGNVCGRCVMNANAAATHVRTKLTTMLGLNTVAGSVAVDDITGNDSSLAITGKTATAAAGGAVVIAGGSTAATYAGGLVSVTGGIGNTTGDGGAVSLIGGESGSGASANGGSVTITGGKALNATTGDGGAVLITGGQGPLLANTGGAVTILSGAGDASNGTAGAIILDSSGTGATKGTITIGTNAASIKIAKMPRHGAFAAVAANGANQATAGVLSEGVNLVSASDNAKGVVLPSCVEGAQCVVINMVTDKSLLIYPPSGKQVNLKGADNAINVAANTVGHFYSEGANAWYGLIAATDVA